MCPGFKSLHRHHPLLKRFRHDLKELGLAGGQRMLLAVSGGGDSVGMLALFLSACPRPDLALGLAHVHHNLRAGEADRDQEFVYRLAETLGLPCASVTLRGKPAPAQSWEEWAREGRYAALESLRERGRWDWLATAHSRDDQAETVLLRIHRGTGLQGLAAIRPVAGRVLRPVLEFSGPELREAATACGLGYIEDSSNRDRRFLRNRLRLDVMPILEASMPGFTRRLSALARLAAEAGPRANPLEFADLSAGTLYYRCDALAALPRGEGLELLRQGLALVRGHLRSIGERHLRALWALREARPGATVALPGGWAGVREKAGIRLGALPAGRTRS